MDETFHNKIKVKSSSFRALWTTCSCSPEG